MAESFHIDLGSLKKKMMSGGISDNKDSYKKSDKYAGAFYHSGSSKKSSYQKSDKYVGAPYNFVSFTDKVYQYSEDRQINHNDVSEELLTGEIIYQITAQTPIIVDDGTGHFCRTSRGQYAIPGSTIRGLIRNNVQILGLSSINEEIDDYALMYRNVTSGSKNEKKRYAKILGVDNSDKEKRGIAKNVKAGFITLKEGIYYINEVKEKFDKETNYLMLSSRYILSHQDQFPFFMEDWKHHMMYTKDCVFERRESITGFYKEDQVKFVYKTEDKEEVRKCIVNATFSFEVLEHSQKGRRKIIEISRIGKPGVYQEKGEVKFKNSKVDKIISYEPKTSDMVNTAYEPYYKPVYFQLDASQKSVISVYSRECEAESLPPNAKAGYVLSSGWLNGKKNLYLFPETEGGIKQVIQVSEDALFAFSADIRKRENHLRQYFKGQTKEEQRERALAFFDLPQNEGQKKPIFYIELDGELYFGFTPRLRIFYEHKIKDGLNKRHRAGILDYSKAIFGYINTENSYKSKVSFLDAVIEPNQGDVSLEEQSRILAEPKPTSYLDYVKQDGAEPDSHITYNNDDMQLRGIKQYWLHDQLVNPKEHVKNISVSSNRQVKEEKGVASNFWPLPAQTTFIGKVRFFNMTENEMGLLLWSMQLDSEKSWMNIGKAKPYGYGNISVKLTSVKKLNKRKAYSLSALELDPFEEINVEELIQTYKNDMKEFLGEPIDKLTSIKEFFTMKDYTKKPEPKKIEYMSIDDKDYQNRKIPLPSVMDVVDDKKKDR